MLFENRFVRKMRYANTHTHMRACARSDEITEAIDY